jgi:hypothetical protein
MRERPSGKVLLLTAMLAAGSATTSADAFPFFLLSIDDRDDWDTISLGSGGIKYVGPAVDPESTDFPCLDHVLYGPGVQHISIIQARGLECLESFTVGDMNRMRRDMTSFAGYIARLRDPTDGRIVNAFTIHNDQFSDPEITPELLAHVTNGLRETFNEEALGRLVYLPTTEQAVQRVRRWIDDPDIELDVSVFFRVAPCEVLVAPGDVPPDPGFSCRLFVRGDSNLDGEVRPGDAIFTLRYLFGGSTGVPTCLDAADANDDGVLTIGDAVTLLSWLYLGGAPLPAPTPTVASGYPGGDCGPDPTDDDLDCESFSRCE